MDDTWYSLTSVSTQAYLSAGSGVKHKIEYSTDNTTYCESLADPTRYAGLPRSTPTEMVHAATGPGMSHEQAWGADGPPHVVIAA